MARYVVNNFTCFVSGEKKCSSFGLLGEMSKLGIVGGCIYEFQRVVDWRACLNRNIGQQFF